MDTKKLDLNLLRALDTLIELGNVTRAAKHLNISQPALSAQLARLRDVFSDPLLVPAQRGVVPTRRALELRGPLREALETMNAVFQSGTFDPTDCDLTLTILATDAVQNILLIPMLDDLRAAAPGLKLAFRAQKNTTIPQMLENGTVDIAFFPPMFEDDRLFHSHVSEETFVVIARPDHPHVQGAITLDAYCAQDHVLVSPEGGGFYGLADRVLERMGRTRAVVQSVESFRVAIDMVRRTDLLCLAPARLVNLLGPDLQTLPPPLPDMNFSVSMFWHQRTNSYPPAIWLRDRIQEHVSKTMN